MIAPPDSTADTMLRALAYSIAALDAASELDVDRSAEDRNFFSQEKLPLIEIKHNLFTAVQALQLHIFDVNMRNQARAKMGDTVLDRGVRANKNHMKFSLRNTMSDGADFVFGSNIEDLVGAELRNEPSLVLDAANRFPHVPEYPGKEEMRNDLIGRADRQEQALDERDNGEAIRKQLNSTVVRLIVDGSDALYRLEARLKQRFLRDRVYIRSFFLDTAPSNRKEKDDPESAKK